MFVEMKKHFRFLPEEWEMELTHGVNLEFWSQGLQRQPQFHIATEGTPVETWGSWTLHDALPVQRKECLTIGLAATSQDPRLKHIVAGSMGCELLGTLLTCRRTFACMSCPQKLLMGGTNNAMGPTFGT